MKYLTILGILNRVPSYGYGKPKTSMREIKKIMQELEYDEDFIDNINDDFCQGFGVARNIITKLLSDRHCHESVVVDNQEKLREEKEDELAVLQKKVQIRSLGIESFGYMMANGFVSISPNDESNLQVGFATMLVMNEYDKLICEQIKGGN